MDILKTSIDWTKAELFSSMFFILFGCMFLAASIGFWQIGKTELAKAYVIPTLIAGVLLAIIGVGIFIQSYVRITGFENAYNADAAAFISSEITRAERVLGDYSLTVFKIIPIIIAVCAVLYIFMETPIWRASLVTTIVMMGLIILVDTNASDRLKAYGEKLALVEK